jgi:hypothetical protein
MLASRHTLTAVSISLGRMLRTFIGRSYVQQEDRKRNRLTLFRRDQSIALAMATSDGDQPSKGTLCRVIGVVKFTRRVIVKA